MRVHFASLTMDLAYNQEKSVTIRRFPTEYETKELKKSKYKLVDDEAFTSDNQIIVELYYNPRRKSVKVISGGNYDFHEGGRYGIDIDIKMTHAEKDLIDYLCKNMKKLCKKHFKPAIVFPSRHSVNCQVDECKLTHNKVKLFLEDFVKGLETEIAEFKITAKEEIIEEKADKEVREIENRLKAFICEDCGKTFDISQRENYFDNYLNKMVTICPDCWNKRRQSIKKCSKCGKELLPSDEEFNIKTVFGEKQILCPNCYNNQHASDNKNIKNKKMSTKWKVTLGILTIIAILSLILLLDSLGLF